MGQGVGSARALSVIVCDAGPVIHLHQAQGLALLERTGIVIVPEAVAKEIKDNIGLMFPPWIKILRLTDRERKDAELWRDTAGLHRGEAEAISMARRQGAHWLLTDDAEARCFAVMLGLEVHGTLGVLLWNFAGRHISKAEALDGLERVSKTSLWLSAKVLSEARQAIHEIHAAKKGHGNR